MIPPPADLGRSVGAGNVTELLAACHESIRYYLAEAERLARATELDERYSESMRAVHSFFDTGYAIHVEDEDERIGAALLEFHGSRVWALVVELNDEHDRTEDLRLRLLADWERWSSEPARAGRGHQHVLHRFSRSTEAHLRREERRLFPLIDQLPLHLRMNIAREIDAAHRAQRLLLNGDTPR